MIIQWSIMLVKVKYAIGFIGQAFLKYLYVLLHVIRRTYFKKVSLVLHFFLNIKYYIYINCIALHQSLV